MGLSVARAGETADDHRAARATIEQWLRMICTDVSVDPTTGEVTMVGPAPGHRSGCNCLRDLIASKRKVLIKPLKHGTTPPIGGGTGKPINRMGGGLTKPRNPNQACERPDGTPGAGSDVDVYIDLGDNDGKHYGHGYPMWFVLAHELTTGHASHVIAGKAKPVRSREEYDTVVCEHGHLVEDPSLTRRDPNHPSGARLAPDAPEPPYQAPAKELDEEEAW
jgi:hypothetical protein